jgi:hypothetical protein
MKNEPDLSSAWPEIVSRGQAALRPQLARRAIEQARDKREDLNTRSAWTVALGTVVACAVLTLAIDLWTTRNASDRAIDAWDQFSVDYQSHPDF